MAEMALFYFGILLIFLFGCFNQSFPLSAPDVSFIAGVVEFRPNQSEDSANVEQNLRAMEMLAEEASGKGVQILVFPEDGIDGYTFTNRTTLYPYLEEMPLTPPADVSNIPCNNSFYENSYALQKLSCIAKRHQLVLVANMGEKAPCSASSDPNCPSDGRYQYEANVVFEADGRFIAKYRKYNLIPAEKENFDVPPLEHVAFTTSFGVTFGLFTCSDLLYKEPALGLVERGVKYFIFTTAWANSLPYFMSIAVQQAWSRKTGTYLLASNYHWPQYSDFPGTGSGIYSSGIPITTFVSGEEFTPASGHLVVAKIPLDSPGEQVVVKPESVGTFRPSNLAIKVLTGDTPVYISYTLPEAKTTTTCLLKYNFKKRYSDETYALGVMIFHRKGSETTAACTLFKCTDASCKDTSFQPTTKAASTIFSDISLTGEFPEGSVIFPIVVGNNYHLFPPQHIHLAGNTLTVKDPVLSSPLLSVSMWTILKGVPGQKPEQNP